MVGGQAIGIMRQDRNPTRKNVLAGVLLLLLPVLAVGQTRDLRLPISLDADSTAYDGKSSMLMFQGLRLSQGSIGIVADEGRATQLDFEDSVWHFSGNVIIDVENGHMESDAADLDFSGYQLRLATITGSPATFEMRRPGSEDATYAEAGRLVYNFDEGIVEFSGDATITEGGNQISSSYLVYNIREQRINASSGGEGDPRVRITYTPGAADETAPPPEPQSDQTPSESTREPPREAPEQPDEPQDGSGGEPGG
jgi:lipopolysaccharide transport protein LptA